MSVRVALIVGSLREGSYSRAIGLEMKALAAPELELDLIEIGDLPLYNPDLDTETPPAAWSRFREELATTQAVLFVTPEYNRSVPGALKNAPLRPKRLGGQARRHRQRLARRPGRLRRQPPPAPAPGLPEHADHAAARSLYRQCRRSAERRGWDAEERGDAGVPEGVPRCVRGVDREDEGVRLPIERRS